MKTKLTTCLTPIVLSIALSACGENKVPSPTSVIQAPTQSFSTQTQSATPQTPQVSNGNPNTPIAEYKDITKTDTALWVYWGREKKVDYESIAKATVRNFDSMSALEQDKVLEKVTNVSNEAIAQYKSSDYFYMKRVYIGGEVKGYDQSTKTINDSFLSTCSTVSVSNCARLEVYGRGFSRNTQEPVIVFTNGDQFSKIKIDDPDLAYQLEKKKENRNIYFYVKSTDQTPDQSTPYVIKAEIMFIEYLDGKGRVILTNKAN